MRISICFSVVWGSFQFSPGVFVGFLAAFFGSTIESVGDYYATARISGVSMPPNRAVNRGILVEGVMSAIGAIFGTGHATTSYSGTIGFIGITGVRVYDDRAFFFYFTFCITFS